MKYDSRTIHTFVDLFLITVAVVGLALLSGCSCLSDYNRHVSAREDGVTVQADERGNYGGTYTHRVEYRAFK